MVQYLAKHGRDITILIVLLWFSIVHYSSLFQSFLSIYYRPYSSWKFLIFEYTSRYTTQHSTILLNYSVTSLYAASRDMCAWLLNFIYTGV